MFFVFVVLFLCFLGSGIGVFGICFWVLFCGYSSTCAVRPSAPCSTSLTMSFTKTNTWRQKCSDMQAELYMAGSQVDPQTEEIE